MFLFSSITWSVNICLILAFLPPLVLLPSSPPINLWVRNKRINEIYNVRIWNISCTGSKNNHLWTHSQHHHLATSQKTKETKFINDLFTIQWNHQFQWLMTGPDSTTYSTKSRPFLPVLIFLIPFPFGHSFYEGLAVFESLSDSFAFASFFLQILRCLV